MFDNSVLIAKADLALSELTSGGGLKPDEVESFIEIAVNPTVLLRRVTVETTGSAIKKIPNLRFSSAILKSGTSGQALPAGARSKPALLDATATAALLKAEVIIPDEIGEDNVDGDQLNDKIRKAAASRVGTDLENLVLNGDTTSADDLLKAFNGLRAEITTNTLAVSPIAYLTEQELEDTSLTMPTEFAEDVDNVFFTSRRARKQFIGSQGARATALGDDIAFSSSKHKAWYDGMEVVALPDMPETLLGAGANNETAVLHLAPKNVHVVFHRQITIKTQEDISSGNAKMVISLRADQAQEYEPAMVQTTGIQVSA